MKKRIVALMLVIVMGVVLTACGSANSDKNQGQNNTPGVNAGTDNNTVPGGDPSTGSDDPIQEGSNTDAEADKENNDVSADSTQAMVDAILAKVEQPSLMDLSSDMLQDFYHLDPALLEQFTIKIPMMNVKTNEIAIFKVKDANDMAAVEEAVKQRAEDVQKQFETYLQDQYENAKNYKIVIKENYLLFVISESADTIVTEFNTLFE